MSNEQQLREAVQKETDTRLKTFYQVAEAMTTQDNHVAALREALIQRLRDAPQLLRTRSMPLSDFIPLIQQAADALSQPMPEAAAQCWCETCRPITLNDMRMVLCPDCGNKRCPKAKFHGNACTNSNEVGQPGSSWEHVKPLSASPAAPAAQPPHPQPQAQCPNCVTPWKCNGPHIDQPQAQGEPRLPPLPEAKAVVRGPASAFSDPESGTIVDFDCEGPLSHEPDDGEVLFTSDQVLEYGAECVQSHREAIAKRDAALVACVEALQWVVAQGERDEWGYCEKAITHANEALGRKEGGV